MGFKRMALAAVFAAVATSAVSAASASAETGGHFTSAIEHTVLSGSESESHRTELSREGATAGEVITCNQVTYEGTLSSTTATALQLSPSYSQCKTAGSPGSTFGIDMNGCSYTLTIGKTAGADNTFDVSCPSEKAVFITHPNCTITLPAQTAGGGTAYTEAVEGGKRGLTVDVTLKNLTAHYHGGVCIFLGTTHSWVMGGSYTVKGLNTSSETVDLRATGSESSEFHTETSHTAVTGAGSSGMSFGVLLGTVECSTASVDGTTTATEYSELTVKPAYSGCKGSGREVTTHTNGCAYVLSLTGTGVDGRVTIECPSGKSIETTIDKFPEGCTITIPAQTAGGVVDYKEEGEGTGRDLLLTWTLEGIHYTRDGCEVGGTGTNGTMGGSITLSGEDTSGNPKGIWIE